MKAGLNQHRAAGRPGLWRPRTVGTAPLLRPSRIGVVRVQAASRQTVPVTISVTKKVEFGEVVKLIGNLPALGDWEPSKAATLTWADGHVWSTTLNVPVGVDVCFKLIRAKHDAVIWENGGDRKFKALGPDFSLGITCKWDDTNKTTIQAQPLAGQTPQPSSQHLSRPPTPQAAAPHHSPSPVPSRSDSPLLMGRSNGHANGNGYVNGHNNGYNSGSSYDGGAQYSRSATPASSALTSMEEDARSTSAWVGAGPAFVRSRPDKGTRQGTWRTDGLRGIEAELVQGDQKADNWLSKLGLMKTLLVDKTVMMRPSVEELAAVYVYATWINTGAITCVESGGHHRPNHHANAALQMFRSLEWVITDSAAGQGLGTWPSEARVLAARRMHTRLPSISGEFRVSTPLTRIRDIAHRNDIPKALKDEIKHTLQNKLHRSAGPEDLVATEAMLARVTANKGEYPEAFVQEFKLFTRELREFFNASGLRELLEQTMPSLDERHRAVVSQFVVGMNKLDAGGGPAANEAGLDEIMACMLQGTQARAYYMQGLSSGLRNDVGDEVLAMRQRWRLAEIRIEDYMFVLLARVIGHLEKMGGYQHLQSNDARAGSMWRIATGALVQGLRHMGLSGYTSARLGKELIILENELDAWKVAVNQGGGITPNPAHREVSLRGKAWSERVQRLASQYSDLVMSIYGSPASRIGSALGLPPHMQSVFGEAEVRASVAFQVSRLAGMLTAALRNCAGLRAWDALVTGEAYGRFVEVMQLSPEAMEKACAGHNDKVVLLVYSAEGDEEVGALGDRLAGIVLRQDLPHLSHLGVRARQEQVVFATCDDPSYINMAVRPLLNKHVRLHVTADDVTLTEAAQGQQAAGKGAAAGSAKTAQDAAGKVAEGATSGTRKVSEVVVVPLRDASVDTCGSKAAKCSELERLAGGAGKGLFTTPAGAVLPFGCMEAALTAGGAAKDFQAALDALEARDLSGDQLEAAVTKVMDVIARASIPPAVLAQVASSFPAGAFLAVRSSANVEDLQGMSAAGLYDSVVGVPTGDAPALARAIRQVWASLYSRRAVLSRRAARVPQRAACMAVLLMELVSPEVSFVLHTARPHDRNTGILLAELAPGQGETLASGTRGSPWRLEVNKLNNNVQTLAFANFSRALVAPNTWTSTRSGSPSLQAMRYTSFEDAHGASGATATATAPAPIANEGADSAAAPSGLVEVEVDYSKQRLSSDKDYRDQVGRQLCKVGSVIETHFGQVPQDIEGGLVWSDGGQQDHTQRIVIVQTRPQH